MVDEFLFVRGRHRDHEAVDIGHDDILAFGPAE
jgi:hypothetical protein